MTSPTVTMNPVKATIVYKPSEVQKILDIGKNSLYALLESGALKGFRIGRHWRVTKDALDEFMEKGGAPDFHG